MKQAKLILPDTSAVVLDVADSSPLADGCWSVHYDSAYPPPYHGVSPAVVCAECGATGDWLTEPDDEGVVDCLACGVFTFPTTED